MRPFYVGLLKYSCQSPRSSPSNLPVSRASCLVQEALELIQVGQTVRSYRGSEMSAGDLVDNLWNLFDRDTGVTGSVVSSVADLFEEGDKRGNIIRAWQDLRVEVGGRSYSRFSICIGSFDPSPGSKTNFPHSQPSAPLSMAFPLQHPLGRLRGHSTAKRCEINATLSFGPALNERPCHLLHLHPERQW